MREHHQIEGQDVIPQGRNFNYFKERLLNFFLKGTLMLFVAEATQGQSLP